MRLFAEARFDRARMALLARSTAGILRDLRASAPRWLPVLILAVGVFVRLWRFGEVPGGMNQDEASMGYDAWSLLHYGIDRNGFPFPVFLVAWGSGMNALASYLSMPFIWLFGLNVFSVRIVNLLAGLLTLPLWYATVKKVAGEKTAVLALFLLAVCPWHIMLSRWGLESNLLPPVFLLGVFLLLHAGEKKWIYPLACVVFGVTLYAYGTAYVATPLFLAVSTAYLLWHRKISKTELLWGAGAFVIVSVPIALFLQINLLRLPSIITPFFSIPRLPGVPRYETVTAFFGTPLERAVSNVGKFWQFLLTQDSTGFASDAVNGFGAIYLWTMPLALLGFLAGVTRARRVHLHYDPLTLMAIWLLAGVVIGCILTPNIHHLNILFFPLLLCITGGVLYLRHRAAVIGVLAVLTIVSFGLFTNDYFTVYRHQTTREFFRGLAEALAYAHDSTGGTICVTRAPNMPYVTALVATRMHPREYLRTVVYENPGAEFQQVASVGRFVFGLNDCRNDADTLVITRDEEPWLMRYSFVQQRFGDYTVAVRRPQDLRRPTGNVVPAAGSAKTPVRP